MKKGFTLAEVLITLAIIGIVAALTIPSVIANAQQQEFKTGLKKAVSVLNEAIQTNIAIEGETPYENENLRDYLIRHMSVIKSGIFVEDRNKYMGNEFFYTTDGMRFEMAQISDGFSNKDLKLHESGLSLGTIKMDPKDPSPDTSVGTSSVGVCGSYGLAKNPNKTVNTPCTIVVDVNGDKKPTPASLIHNSDYNFDKYKYPSPNDKKLTDVFLILITEDKAIPFGVVAQRAMYSK